MKIKSIFFPIVLSAFLLGCGGTSNNDSTTDRTKPSVEIPKDNPAPEFSEDSSYAYIQKQVDFGPRVPNTKPHEECKDYLINELKRHGCEVITQEFEIKAYNGVSLKSTNIMGRINPKATKRVLLTAHWDTRPYADQDSVDTKKPIDGANDGASGVGVLLEIARSVKKFGKQPAIGIDILFFDSEDYGAPDDEEAASDRSTYYCLGSQYWVKIQ